MVISLAGYTTHSKMIKIIEWNNPAELRIICICVWSKNNRTCSNVHEKWPNHDCTLMATKRILIVIHIWTEYNSNANVEEVKSSGLCAVSAKHSPFSKNIYILLSKKVWTKQKFHCFDDPSTACLNPKKIGLFSNFIYQNWSWHHVREISTIIAIIEILRKVNKWP